MEITVGIADLRLSQGPDDSLVTYALGSCIAVLIHAPVPKLAGLLHYMLPSSSVSPEKARSVPAMFADTGIPALIARMNRRGVHKSDLMVKVAGGAQLYDDGGMFDIGRRNYAAVRELFDAEGIKIVNADVGGSLSRTVRIWAATGRVTVHSQGKQREL
ncbi:MAG: chemotaxis protein CheD [Deltaproteobacteria bacterium]|nr:chemotaxis protein CheD [Deltaproteobacteria bacterium]